MSKISNNLDRYKKSTIYLWCVITTLPYIYHILIDLFRLPSLSKFFFFTTYCLLATCINKKFQLLFVFVAYSHAFISMFAAKAFDQNFPSLFATISFYLFLSYVGCYRGYLFSRVLLLFSLSCFPFILFIESPYGLMTGPSILIVSLFISCVLYITSGIFAIYELVCATKTHQDSIKYFFFEVLKSSIRPLNGILLFCLSFLIYLKIYESPERQMAGSLLVSSFLMDITEFISIGTREQIDYFFNLDQYGWLSIFIVVTVFFYQAAKHHAQVYYGVSYHQLLVGEIRSSKNPFLQGTLAIFAWLVGSLIYYVLLVFSLPENFDFLIGQVTWRTTAFALSLGAAVGLILSIAVRIRKIHGVKFKVLRFYVSKRWYVQVLRFMLLFGPSIVIAPFFAWKTLVSSVLLLLGCYALIGSIDS